MYTNASWQIKRSEVTAISGVPVYEKVRLIPQIADKRKNIFIRLWENIFCCLQFVERILHFHRLGTPEI